MLNVFISSTSRDLKEFRKLLIDKLDETLISVGMEKFIPDGSHSQIKCIKNLKSCDIIIFLITSYYGSFIDKCLIDECTANCPMKQGNQQISYTHCEYKITYSNKMNNQTYLFDEGWNLIKKFKEDSKNQLELKEIKKDERCKELSNGLLNHYSNVSKSAWIFYEEISSRETYMPYESFKDHNIISDIGKHLVYNIVKWHSEEKLKLKEFCNRKEQLKEIIQNIDHTIEVTGFFGIGKTTLIQLSLLLLKLKGNKIIYISPKGSFSSGSGYGYFQTKFLDKFYDIQVDEITIDDFINLLVDFIYNIDVIRRKPNYDKIKIVSNILKDQNIVLYIDEFDTFTLISEEVIELFKISPNIIISTNTQTDLPIKKIKLNGIPHREMDELISIFEKKFNVRLAKSAKVKIKEITEGHPRLTEFLISRYDKIKDLENVNEFKSILRLGEREKFESKIKQVLLNTLTPDAFSLLKDLSLINVNLKNNIDWTAIRSVYKIDNFVDLFDQLIDSFLIKKRSDKVFTFFFKYIQNIFRDDMNAKGNNIAIEYYKNKQQKYGKNYDDLVEILYHQSRISVDEDVIAKFNELKNLLTPDEYNFERLITIGNYIKNQCDGQNKANILISLGEINFILNRFDQSKNCLLLAEEIIKELEAGITNKYITKSASIKHNLGVLNWKLMNYKVAVDLLTQTLKLSKNLVKKNPKVHLPSLAKVYNDLGNLYYDLDDYKKSKEFYLNAIKVHGKIEKEDQEKYLSYLAKYHNNLGNSYSKGKEHKEAEVEYKTSLTIKRELLKKKQEIYSPEIALTLTNLGDLYAEMKKFIDSKEAYMEALEIRYKLSKRSFLLYAPLLAKTFSHLGTLIADFGGIEDNKKTEFCFLKALRINKQLVEKNRILFLPNLVDIIINTGTFFLKRKDNIKAETYFSKALKICQEISNKNLEYFQYPTALCHNCLGVINTDKGNYLKARDYYEKALNFYLNFQDKYLEELTLTYINLAINSEYLGDFDHAKKAFEESIKIFERLERKKPGRYIYDLAQLRFKYGLLKRRLRRRN